MSLKTETLATNMCNVSKQKGLHEIFFSMAEKIPEHIAVIWYENTRKEISYQDLADCVLKMAQMLKVNGIRENEYIAVSMPKGIWQIISTLAILSVGCTYIPIDIDWPLERKKKICKKVNARILVELSSIPINRGSISISFGKRRLFCLWKYSVPYLSRIFIR